MSPEAPNELKGLRIDVEVAKDTVLIGEPLIVTLRLTNTGADTLNVSARINETPRGSPVGFVFLRPGGESAPWRTLFEVDRVPPQEMRQIGPGDYVIARFNLAAGTNPPGIGSGRVNWTCPKAGSYSVMGRYTVPAAWDENLWHGMIESSPAGFEVREPEGRDRLAFDALNNRDLMAHYLGIPPPGSSVREALSKVIADCPSSTYAIYADYLLGMRVLGLEDNVEHLRRFIANHPDFPLAPDADFKIADLLYHQERFDEARAQLAAASQRYPHDAHTTDLLATQMRDARRDVEMVEANRRHREVMKKLGLTDGWYHKD